MANIILNISKADIYNNATRYGISDIRGLCDKILGLMSYTETDEEYNFLVNTVFPDINYYNLPDRYLVKAAQVIRDILNTKESIFVRAKVYYNMAEGAWKEGDIATYDKYHKMLIEMVRDKAISPEFLRDQYGIISAN